jgi:hypothetical protein
MLFRKAGDGGKKGCKTACIAVMRYLAVRHENPELAVPFDALIGAFTSVEKGVLPEIFNPKSRPSKRSRSELRAYQRLWAAAALDVLMKVLHKNESYATKVVARHVAKWAYMAGNAVSATTVRHWRNKIYAKPEKKRRLKEIVSDLRKRPDVSSRLQDILINGPPSQPGVKKPT